MIEGSLLATIPFAAPAEVADSFFKAVCCNYPSLKVVLG